MRFHPLPRAARAAVFLVLALGARASSAQTISGFALDRFEPAGAGSPWLTLESLDFDGHLRPSFAAAADWAWHPLVFRDPGGQELAPLVREQAMFYAGAAATLWSRARVDVMLPIPILSTGGNVQIRDQSYGGPSSGGVGDLRLGGDVRVFHGPHDAWRAGVGAQLFLPTGGTSHFTSDGGFRFWPRLMVAGERGRLIWAGRAGVHVRPRSSGGDLAPGSEATLGASAGWWLMPNLLLTAELYGSKLLSSGGPFGRASAPLELLLGSQVALTPQWRVRLGFGPGLTDGPGSPAVRVVLGVSYDMTPPPPPRPTPLP